MVRFSGRWVTAWVVQDDFQAVTGLVRKGHRVFHLVPAHDQAGPQQAIEGVEVVTYVHPRMPIITGSRLRHFFYLNYCILRAARTLMRRTRFDVVVGHAALLAPAVSAMGYLTRVPSVLNIYGTFLLSTLAESPPLSIPRVLGLARSCHSTYHFERRNPG